MTAAWEAYQSAVDLGRLFPLLDEQLAPALNALTGAVAQRDSAATRKAVFDVAVATLDLQLPYRSRLAVDFDRLDLWTRRVGVDSAAAQPGHVAGDVTILEFIWQRVGYTVEAAPAQAIEVQLAALRAAADAEDLPAAAEAAAQLHTLLAALPPAP